MHIFRNLNNVDLVKLHGLQFYLPKNDNLYENFIKPQNKFQARRRYPMTAGMDVDIYGEIVRKFHMSDKKLFEIIDIGSWVGDFGIYITKLSKEHGLPVKAFCVDPSHPAKLVEPNARINNVRKEVSLIRRALNTTNGTVKFRTNKGHSDSAHIDGIDFANQEFSVRKVKSITLNSLRKILDPDSFKIFKFDLEGIDAEFLYHPVDFVGDIVVFEFGPLRKEWLPWIAKKVYLEWLSSHRLFDIGYAPSPDRFIEIEPNFEEFCERVLRREYGYTDILAIPRNATFLDSLIDLKHRTFKDNHYFMD